MCSSMTAPRWLRALDKSTRNRISHVEIATQDIAETVCMMATLGFKLSHRLSREQYLAVMSDLRDMVIWLTFKPIEQLPHIDFELLKIPKGKRGGIDFKLPEIPKVSVWTEAEESDASTIDPSSDGSTIKPSSRQRDSMASLASISTSVLSLGSDDAGEDVIRQGVVARRAELVRVVDMDEEADGAGRKAFEADRAVVRPRRSSSKFSFGQEILRRVTGPAEIEH